MQRFLFLILQCGFDEQANQIQLSIPTDILMGTITSVPSPLSSPTPYLPDYDIIQSVPPAGYMTLSFIEFCKGLSSSQEATHATVTSVTRWVNTWGVPHRFLILHAVVGTGNRDLFFRLDRRRDHQESFVSSSIRSIPSDTVRFYSYNHHAIVDDIHHHNRF